MAIRLSGLTSGLDTDAIVKELVSAYSIKTQKYTKEQTKLSWKQDIWKSLNAKIYSLYTNISNLRYSAAYATKKTTCSDPTKATVTASGTAVNGSQTLNIISTAKSAYMTGGKIQPIGLEDAGKVELSDLRFDEDKDVSFYVTTNGTTTEIKVNGKSTIDDVVNQLNDAGVEASFDAEYSRFVLSGKDGESFKLSTSADGSTNTDGLLALKNLGLSSTKDVQDLNGSQIKLPGLTVKQDGRDTKLKDLGFEEGKDVSFFVKSDKGTFEISMNDKSTVKDVLMQLKDAGLEADYDSEYDRIILKGQDGGSFQISTTEDGTGSNADALVALKNLGLKTAKDVQELDGDQLKLPAADEDEGLTSSTTLKDLGYNIQNDTSFRLETTDESGKKKVVNIKVNRDSSINDVVAQIKEAGLNANFDEKNGRIYISSKETGKNSDFTISAASGDANSAKVLSILGLNAGDGENGAKKIDGQDAEIRLNGVLYTSSKNTFDINGLSITAEAVTGDGEENAITINTNTDTTAIYDKIKDFLTEYNNLINEITKLYNADSARGYDPLTDDEKDAMSDTEIEKWETKIKDSLLRRDSSLDSIMSAMIRSMSTSYQVNGKQYSLSSFGIQTLGYLNAAENEHNAYHIDGDEEDSNSSDKEDKLRAAINDDPDTVIEFMKQLATGLYTAIDSKMKSTELSSAYKVYNDKEMDKQYTNYTKLISEWEDKVAEKEDYYYKKFTAMETALAKLQNQTNSLTGLFGS